MPWCSPYLGSKDAQIALFDDLANRHVECAKETIGYSVKGKPIPMYRVGNPLGGKILFDGAIHGCSDLSTLVHYHYLKWLLESGEERALNILRKNCILAVPILNIDECIRKNSNGVDLNRNFTHNWDTMTSADNTDPNSQHYKGPSPASEPEVQAMIALFNREKPQFYVNFHNWGGPYCASYNANTSQRTVNDQVARTYAALAQQSGVVAYPYTSGGLSAGMAASDAAKLGINSWIIELCVQNAAVPPLSEIEPIYYPKAKPFHITLSEAPISTVKQSWLFKQWQDGDTNPTKTINA